METSSLFLLLQFSCSIYTFTNNKRRRFVLQNSEHDNKPPPSLSVAADRRPRRPGGWDALISSDLVAGGVVQWLQ